MATSIGKLVRNLRTIDTKDNLLHEAMEALIRATNNLDPYCIFCGCDATPDGNRHGPECIVSRIRACLLNASETPGAGQMSTDNHQAPSAGSESNDLLGADVRPDDKT